MSIIIVSVIVIFYVVVLMMALPWLAPCLERLADLPIFGWYDRYMEWVDKKQRQRKIKNE